MTYNSAYLKDKVRDRSSWRKDIYVITKMAHNQSVINQLQSSEYPSPIGLLACHSYVTAMSKEQQSLIGPHISSYISQSRRPIIGSNQPSSENLPKTFVNIKH